MYPLAGPQPVVIVTDTLNLQAQTRAAGQPLLWLTRKLTNTYTLVSVGTPEPLAALRISDTNVITPFVTAPGLFAFFTATLDVIGDPSPNLRLVTLTLWLEAPNGVRYPFTVQDISHVDSMEQIETWFTNGALALLPGEEGSYQVIMVASSQDRPAPGSNGQNCRFWRSGGWLYRVWHALRC